MKMNKQIVLKSILGVSLAGMLFSGYLSYFEIFQQVCGFGGVCSTKILTIPSCVYGFVVYLIVFVLSIIGLKCKKVGE